LGGRDKLVTVVGHQLITLTVNICVQHGGRKAPRHAGLLSARRGDLLPRYVSAYYYTVIVRHKPALYKSSSAVADKPARDALHHDKRQNFKTVM